MIISCTGERVRNRKFLSKTARIMAPAIPTSKDFTVKVVNSHPISRGEFHERGKFEVVQMYTALKRMIDTASLTIPSPKTIE